VADGRLALLKGTDLFFQREEDLESIARAPPGALTLSGSTDHLFRTAARARRHIEPLFIAHGLDEFRVARQLIALHRATDEFQLCSGQWDIRQFSVKPRWMM
jgi:hypothetical protein